MLGVVKLDEALREDPPLATLYQFNPPAQPDAPNTTVPVPQREPSIPVGAVGVGSTFTVTVNVFPVQLPDAGVTVYVAVCTVPVGLFKVPLMFDALLPAAPPVIPPVTVGADQLYVVPAGTIPFVTFAGVTVNPIPLHTVEVIAFITGVGFTVTVTVNVEPAQVPDVGVTVYVAVCNELVGLFNVPLILDVPLPAAPPVIPPVTAGADQLYVVPTGTTPLVPFTGVTVNELPLHVDAVIAVIDGFGFTVTV